ncbi:DUF3667 domain-containing protein [Hyphobacterium sp.]|uniref:DUF3667 domain-containing protein n=1 Tax=Hyphobacterium sp. TaxID=2004662 RepID=UPI003B51636E
MGEEGSCANCGTGFSGEYCPACGQSRTELKRPIVGLVTDAMDGLLTWDGRLARTYRGLFRRPGRVARDFMDGHRRAFTPPIRLYLIVSLLFFAAMELSGVRVIAVTITQDAEGEAGVFITMFQPPRDAPPVVPDAEAQAEMLRLAEEEGVPQRLRDLTALAMNNPDIVEERAGAAASQAMILMVIVFAALSGLLHPRRKLIEHVVHALYFHAALLLPFAAVIIMGIHLPMPLEAAIGIAIASILALGTGMVLFDRGFYASSWIGASLRALPLLLGYILGATLAAIGLIAITAL